MNNTAYRYINVVDESIHGRELTMEKVRKHTENFSKPALFRNMAGIDPKLSTRAFFQEIEPEKTVQWRRKNGDAPVSMRDKDGKTDYNYIIGQVGTGSEFLDDIFERQLDVYSHLGMISAGYKDPYEWGKLAFARVKEEIFRNNWFNIPTWNTTGHMFLGHSNQEYGEPMSGAVGSDWHMFPTLNVFVMIAGMKKWMTRPPYLLEQFEGDTGMFSTSSGREAPGAEFDHDAVHVHPGDVLLNMPYEWHKVLNNKGFSLGAAFRVIDTQYISTLEKRPAIKSNLPQFKDDMTEDVAHLLTSLKYASLHLNRAQMMLNDGEHAYSVLLKMLRNRAGDKMKQESKQIAVVD